MILNKKQNLMRGHKHKTRVKNQKHFFRMSLWFFEPVFGLLRCWSPILNSFTLYNGLECLTEITSFCRFGYRNPDFF